MKLITLFCLISSALFSDIVDTFYGPLQVEEPVILELIKSPAFQRLKSIHQYGVAFYATIYREKYTRYDHSLGVFAILRLKGASLEEQIAGLLHDVSHTVFSHVGDWVFNKEHQENDYQTTIHLTFLEQNGLAAILQKHGFTSERLLPKEELFPALEQKLPNLCADRIEYNIQGAYRRGDISYSDVKKIVESLSFTDGNWISTEPELMKKIVRFSLSMNLRCWGNAANHLYSRWLADAILKGLDLGLISYHDIHTGTDQIIWERLRQSTDPFIQEKMKMVLKTSSYYKLVSPDKADLIIRPKFRGIDPWIRIDSKLVRLTTLDPVLAKEYQETKETLAKGWAIQLVKQESLFDRFLSRLSRLYQREPEVRSSSP